MSVYVLLSIEVFLVFFLLGMGIVRDYRDRQWKKMWSKIVRPVTFPLFEIVLNPEVILVADKTNRLTLLSRGGVQTIDQIRQRVDKNKVPVQNRNSFHE